MWRYRPGFSVSFISLKLSSLKQNKRGQCYSNSSFNPGGHKAQGVGRRGKNTELN
jgi:hypothetical protein